MRVMVALEDRFFRTRDGHVYSNTIFNYDYWKRYLQIFDEVMVLARVCDIAEYARGKMPANGPGVSFFSLPYYVGFLQYIGQHFKLVAAMKQATGCADVFILRIPGRISTLLWHQLMKEKIPYAIEVVGSSADSGRTSGANFLVRVIHKLLAGQKEQCEHAGAASYVTRNFLQNQYPAGCWSTYYSSIELSDEAIITSSKLEQKIISLQDVESGERPLKICHAGTMEVAYKAQDILLESVAICLAKGLKAELLLLGDGRLAAYYKSKAEQLDINKYVKFLGMLPAGDAVREQFDMADMFVLPSKTEGLPRVVIEAMARGLPCIAANVGGLPELLESEYLVAAGDAQSLANKIIEVSNDIDRLKKMSNRNWEEAKKYRAVVINQRRIEFYRRAAGLVGSRASRR